MDKSYNHNVVEECSIVIPVYKRHELIRTILISLSEQNHADNIKNIFICDSEIDDEFMKEVIEHCKPLYKVDVIKHIFVENNLSAKRNAGIKAARTENIILIDDDCVPGKDFIINHLKYLNRRSNTIYCGVVEFDKLFIKSSNYIKYKSRRQESFNDSNHVESEEYLDFTKIIAMNMSCTKKLILDNKLFFDEEFLGYGMEDNEFGWRVQKHGIQIKKCQARIIHNEINDLDSFCRKIYHLARDGMTRFIQKNSEAVWKISFCKYLEPNYPYNNTLMIFICWCLRNIILNRSALLIKYYLIITDKISFLYCENLYKYVLAYYYTKGVIHRGNHLKSNKDTKEGFYNNII